MEVTVSNLMEINESLIDYPVIVTRNRTILPGVLAHVDIADEISFTAFKAAMAQDKKILMVAAQDENAKQYGIHNIYRYGTIALIKQAVKNGEQSYRIMVEGVERARLYKENEEFTGGYLRIFVAEAPHVLENTESHVAKCTSALEYIRERFTALMKEGSKVPKEYAVKIMTSQHLFEDIWKIVSILTISNEKRQELFEEEDILTLLEEIAVLIENEIEMCKVANDFRQQVKNKVDKNQKEYILKEQMRLIRQELGEEQVDEYEHELQEKVGKLNADDSVKQRLYKELRKLKRMSPQSSEANVLQNYVETMISLPWNNETTDNDDLKKAKEILNNAHYGLEQVKERIVEYLAVKIYLSKKKNEDNAYHSPIICLVGPPGTGKTSIARSVAEAMGKKYARICLGGVSDEAEIRGHRRTYIGAKPGRIIDTLIKAGTKNPLIVFDEIDKLGKDYKGDPSSALLEVLDGEQNVGFVDRYIEEPVDLSGVFFMATANDISGIPKPLKDRMEIITVNSYTTNEKEHIAKDYLLKKQRKAHGLEKKELTITAKAVNRMILQYTKEAGVRELERLIGKLCRQSAIGILEKEFAALKITDKNLVKYLGNPKYKEEKKNNKAQVGIVRGLAWTSVGGDTLEIEVNTMPGTGKLKVTGQLGDVMKESAQIAYSYVRMLAPEYNLDKTTFSEQDFHLHVPEGAVPKDGPSAGITMATALFSAVTGKKVSADVAMTGEVTLRGNVLPIGGLKEKILAAKLFGISKVIVPEQNQKDVEEIQDEILDGMEILYVNDMQEVLQYAII